MREERCDVGGGRIAAPLRAIAADCPDLGLGSYPFHEEGIHGTNIVAKGHDEARVDEALARLRRELGAR